MYIMGGVHMVEMGQINDFVEMLGLKTPISVDTTPSLPNYWKIEGVVDNLNLLLFDINPRYTPILSSYFHFLESINTLHICFVFSFHDQHWKELFTLQITSQIYFMVKYIQWMYYPHAMLSSFLAGPVNLRKFITTWPEGTRQPDF